MFEGGAKNMEGDLLIFEVQTVIHSAVRLWDPEKLLFHFPAAYRWESLLTHASYSVGDLVGMFALDF